MGKQIQARPTEALRRPSYKRGTMPLYGESVLNFILKLVIGVVVFWLLYYPLFEQEMDFLTQFSYLMLLSMAASITALVIAYLFVALATRLLRRPKKGVFDINHFPDRAAILYEMLAVTFTALFMATGILLFLDANTATWEQFLLLYFAVKFMTRLLAYGLSVIIGNNLMFTLGFVLCFFALLMVSVMHLTGWVFFEKQ